MHVIETEVGATIGADAQAKVGFYGSAGKPQRSGAAQAAIGAPTYAAPEAGAVDTGDAGSDTVITSLRTQFIALAADVVTHKTLVNELRAALVRVNLIPGA
jgi:hypothetical protein